MRLVAVLLVVGLAGCASPNMFFTHPNVDSMTDEQFTGDLKACEYEALKYAQVVDPRYGDLYGSFDLQERRRTLTSGCMEVKGYRRISDEEYYARRKAKGL